MNDSTRRWFFGAVVCLMAFSVAAQVPMGTAFTYQGRMNGSGVPVSGSYDFLFRLFDLADPVAGIQVGPTVPIDDLEVINGLINVELDFGSGVFSGDALWLEVSVRPGSSEDSYTQLLPRTSLTPAPTALFSVNAEDSETLDGLNSTDFVRVAGDTVTGTLDITGSLCLSADCRTTWPSDILDSLLCGNGEIAKWNGPSSAWQCSGDIDTTLTESNVELMITNGALNLHADTTVGGNEISVAGHQHGSEPFVGQIMLVPWDFCPIGWTEADGKLIDIFDNTALFSLLGTTFGGNGTSNFAVPDLRGRFPLGEGQGTGLTYRATGQSGGTETVSLTEAQIPSHTHDAIANSGTDGNTEDPTGNFWSNSDTGDPDYNSGNDGTHLSSGSIGNSGGDQSHQNMPPFLVMRYCIALEGAYPVRP